MNITLEVFSVILGIILSLIALYGLLIGGTFLYWIYKFLKHGDS